MRRIDRFSIPGDDFGELVRFAIEKGASVKFKVTGKSMRPNIHSGDVVTIVPFLDRKPEIGDVVAFSKSGTRNIIVHRIVTKRGNTFLLKGDYLFKSDGFVEQENIEGLVNLIERDNQKVATGSKRKKALLSRLRIFCLYKPFFFFKYKKDSL